jgi:heterodisulfide reductase subunit C
MLSKCFDCGICRSHCPVYRLGMPSFPLSWKERGCSSEVWNCTNCWLCHELCPRGIDLWQLKSQAQRQTAPPRQVSQYLNILYDRGLSLPITPEINDIRQAYGLDPITLVNHKFIHELFDC